MNKASKAKQQSPVYTKRRNVVYRVRARPVIKDVPPHAKFLSVTVLFLMQRSIHHDLHTAASDEQGFQSQ
jgi:hypothetical protein